MSGARFARSGRARFLLCFLALVLMLGMVAIFHNTTRQLDKTREEQMQCEQQQETLNEQLQAIIEQKYTLQKNYDEERNEQMKTRLDLEQNLKKKSEQITKEQSEAHLKYEKLQQAHKLLQTENKECTATKQKHIEEINELNRKFKDEQIKTQKQQTELKAEITNWQDKYNALVQQNTRLLQLEDIMSEYKEHCAYQPKGLADLKNDKQLELPHIPVHTSPHSEHEKVKKSFNQQVRLEVDRYQININTQPTIQNQTVLTTANKTLISSAAGDGLIGAIVLTTVPEPMAEHQNRSLILNSVENFQILPKLYQKLTKDGQGNNKVASPLSAPHKSTSTEASKIKDKQQLDMAKNSSVAQVARSSTSNLPPLPLPPQSKEQQQQSRKLPENVAPIPENFEDLWKDDTQHQQQQQLETDKKTADSQAAVNVADKPEEAKNQHKDDTNGNNNRYANVVNDMGGNHALKENDAADVHDQNFNVPAVNEDENNFFDTAETNNKHNVANLPNAAALVAHNNNDDNFLGNGDHGGNAEAAAELGDIEVKQKKHLLDADNVNNEVAGDQGKEFDDGLHLEDGIEEDVDEDDYDSNVAARQQGEQAVRN